MCSSIKCCNFKKFPTVAYKRFAKKKYVYLVIQRICITFDLLSLLSQFYSSANKRSSIYQHF